MSSTSNNESVRPADVDIARALGRIEGKIDALQTTSQSNAESIAKLDTRLRAVEKSSAVHGAVGGGFAGLGITLIVEYLKRSLGS
jgi:hypothetical protein